jgi:hypothetical protein
MPTVRSGQLATKGTNAVLADRLVINMQNKIYTYDAGSNPALRALSMRASMVRIDSTEANWLEDEPVPEWDTTTASGTSSTDPVPVSNGTYHKAGDVLLVPQTGEYIRVISVSANNLTTTRGYAGSTAAAYDSGEKVLNLGLMDMEGNTSPVAKATVAARKSNYTRILKTPVHLSRTLSQTKLYGGENERSRLRVKAAAKHARLLEQDFFHGRKREDTSTATNPIRMAGGLDEFITTNVLAAGGALSESEFFEFIGQVMRFGVDGGSSDRRAVFGGQAFINSISQWGTNKLQTDSGRNQRYGFSVRTLLSPYGELDIVYHPLLEEEYAGTAYIVDMSGIKVAQLQPTILETNIQTNDEDGFKDQYLSEQTYLILQEKAHARITGITF